jgi:predicted HTH transcriptional regulator
MNVKKLKLLMRRQESSKLDFKLKIDIMLESGKKELAKDVCAIANSRGGRGHIIIGIEDKTKNIVGIKKDEYNEETIQQIISSRCEPPIPIDYEVIELDGALIGIITIYDGGQRPYQIRDTGTFYIRRGSTTDVMRKQEIASALQDNLALNIELCPISNSDIGCLDLALIERYFSANKIYINDENRITLMENASIIKYDKECGKYRVTLGGILVFSRINNVYIPHNLIRIVNRINGNEPSIILIKGDLSSMLNECEAVLNKLLPSGYPIGAIYEGVKNAVIYRDYTIYYKEIEIILSYENISIISPGAFINNKDINNHNYVKRNMWIYEKLVALDDKNRFMKSVRGFSIMKKSFKNIGKVLFINSTNNDFFKVVYPGAGKT